jgi:hypothetical protein
MYDKPLPLPSCKVYLLRNEKVSVRRQNLHPSRSNPPPADQAVHEEHHNWDKETFNKVNLEAYASARRSN